VVFGCGGKLFVLVERMLHEKQGKNANNGGKIRSQSGYGRESRVSGSCSGRKGPESSDTQRPTNAPSTGTVLPLFDKETRQRDRTEAHFPKAAGNHYSRFVKICICDFSGGQGHEEADRGCNCGKSLTGSPEPPALK
jgi:hypothetical protein